MNRVNKQVISKVIPYTIFLLAVYSILTFSKPGMALLTVLNNTILWWIFSTLILFVLFSSCYYFFDKKNRRNLQFVLIYLIWNVVCIVRGMFIAELYWDWKVLIGNSMALMLPIAAYAATNKMVVQSTLSFYLKYTLPLFFIFVLMVRPDAYGFFLAPLSLLLLFLPALTLRQKTLLLFFSLIVILSDLSARSNVIKFIVPLIILTIYYLRKRISIKTIEAIRISFFIIPIIFFVLGISGIFNIFKISDYLRNEITTMSRDGEGNRIEVDITADTRTFIYAEVLQSAAINHYWLFGRTPARGNDSYTFGAMAYELTHRNERVSNEVGLSNVFTWTGITGLFLYLLIYLRASFLAVNRSKNIYAKMLGVMVAFRWLYAWVEDVNNFSLNYFMLWMMIGLCFSYTFREMSNRDVLIWVRGIFDVRYKRYHHYLNNKRRNE